MIRVTIWNEFRSEREKPAAMALYPNGLHNALADILACEEISVRTATLDEAEQGLPACVLEQTDVLCWWGHIAHSEVLDALVERIHQRVQQGMGIIFLHSAHKSKPFSRIVGSSGNLTWGQKQRCIIWNLAPTHPIAQGIPSHFELEEEMYGEPFYIPTPQELVFASWFEQGNLFRGGVTYTRGLGKVFYFHAGHESCRAFFDEHVQRILKNAVRWCAPTPLAPGFDNTQCIKQIEKV